MIFSRYVVPLLLVFAAFPVQAGDFDCKTPVPWSEVKFAMRGEGGTFGYWADQGEYFCKYVASGAELVADANLRATRKDGQIKIFDQRKPGIPVKFYVLDNKLKCSKRKPDKLPNGTADCYGEFSKIGGEAVGQTTITTAK